MASHTSSDPVQLSVFDRPLCRVPEYTTKELKAELSDDLILKVRARVRVRGWQFASGAPATRKRLPDARDQQRRSGASSSGAASPSFQVGTCAVSTPEGGLESWRDMPGS